MNDLGKSLVYQKAYPFAKDIVFFYKKMKKSNEYVLSKQILKSGTSIAANITEANGGISRDDFSAKMSIAYKECLETKYWIELLHDTNYMDTVDYENLKPKADEIGKILFSILKSCGRIKSSY